MEELRNKIISNLDKLSENELILIKRTTEQIIQRKLNTETEAERKSLFPIRDVIAWEKYNEQKSMLWPANEVVYDSDRIQFNDPNIITPRQRELFTQIIGFFIPADGAIIENVLMLMAEANTFEELLYFGIQNYIEGQHAEGYNRAAKEFFVDDEEFNRAKNLVETSLPHKRKMDFIQKYSISSEDQIIRYAASACMEGIFFMGLFPIIFYFINLNLLQGFTHLNEQIFKDESLHCRFYSEKVKEKLQAEKYGNSTRERIIEVVKEAVEVEKEFIRFILYAPIIDEETDAIITITPKNICDYVEMIADGIVTRFGLSKIYGTVTTLPWTEGSVMAVKGNKYEKPIGSYAHTELQVSKPTKRRERF